MDCDLKKFWNCNQLLSLPSETWCVLSPKIGSREKIPDPWKVCHFFCSWRFVIVDDTSKGNEDCRGCIV